MHDFVAYTLDFVAHATDYVANFVVCGMLITTPVAKKVTANSLD